MAVSDAWGGTLGQPCEGSDKPSQGSAQGIASGALVALGIAAALVAGVSLWRMATAIPNDAGLGHANGVWVGLATDLAEGIFYRPLYQNGEYGGGRYAPLPFALHAALVRAGMDPIRAGYPVTLAAVVGLVAGVYLFLRRFGVGRAPSASLALIVLSPRAVQEAIVMIRGDLPAAAFGVWGLVFAAKLTESDARRSFSARRTPGLPAGRVAGGQAGAGVVAAALSFALAFLCKVTSVFGAGAAFLALFLSGRRREAWRLLGWTAGIAALLSGVTCLLSGGRALEYFLRCGSGGATWHSMLRAPWVAFVVSLTDPPAMTFLLLACGALLGSRRATWRTLPGLWLLLAGAVIVALFGSPGIYFNQFMELEVAAIVFCGVIFLGSRPAPASEATWASRGACLMALTAVFSIANAAREYHRQDARPLRAQLREVLDMAPKLARGPSGGSEKPLLSENDLLPILNHERPCMLDCAAFRVLALKDKALADQFRHDLETRRFRAVILMKDPRAEPDWYRDHHFGPGFVEKLMECYKFLGAKHGYFVFVPR